MPYLYAVMDLAGENHLEIITNIIQCVEEKLQIGMPVKVVWWDVAPGIALSAFRLTDAARLRRSSRGDRSDHG